MTQITEESARGGFFLFSGATLASVILAVSAIVIGRLLGPELYGQYTLVLVIPQLLLLFTDLGLNVGITKFTASLRAADKIEQISAIIRYGLILRLVIGVIVSLISVIFASYFALIINRPDFTFFIQIASLSVIFQVVYSTANSALVGLDKSEYSALLSATQAVARAVLQIVLVIFSFGVTSALVGYVGGFVVSATVGLFLLFFKIERKYTAKKTQTQAEHKSEILELLTKYSMPVYVAVVLTGLFPLYQQVVVAFFASDFDIGNFRAAYNFLTLLTVISASITVTLLPAFSKLEAATSEALNAFFHKANKYTCLLIVPITTAAILLSEPIVELLYGTVYTSAALFLSLNCSIFLLSIIGYMTLTSFFNGLGKTRITLTMTLINFIVLLVLSPILAQAYGIVGAIIAYLVAGILASVYAAIIAVKQFKIHFNFKPIVRIYVISILAALPTLTLLFFTELDPAPLLLLGAIVYLFVYITLLPLLGVLTTTEINTFTKIVQKIGPLKFIVKPVVIYIIKVMTIMKKRKK